MSGSVLQSGAITPGHVATWLTNGTVIDGGTVGNGIITEVGITNPGGLALAINSGTISGPYAELGFSIGTNSVATLSVDAFNGAPAAGLVIEINGTTYPFPGPGSGNVIGPSAAVSGDIVPLSTVPPGLSFRTAASPFSAVISLRSGIVVGILSPRLAALQRKRSRQRHFRITSALFSSAQCFGQMGYEGPVLAQCWRYGISR